MKTRTFITTSNADGAGALLSTAALARFAQIMFRVPTEPATAATTQQELDIPAAIPAARVSYRAEPGWDGELVTEALSKASTVDTTTLIEATTTLIWPGTDTEHPSPTLDASDGPAALSVVTLRRTVRGASR